MDELMYMNFLECYEGWKLEVEDGDSDTNK